MKVFISWSGEKSRAVATAFHDWVVQVLNNAQPWMSDTDIDAGSRWGVQIDNELEGAVFGVICVSPDNQDKPWLNYEAGAISKQVGGIETRVAPLLIDFNSPSDIDGPMSKFHAKLANKEGISSIVQSINNAMNTPRPKEHLDKAIDVFWPSFSEELDKINATQPAPTAEARSDRAILEEVLQITRGLHTNQFPDRSLTERRQMLRKQRSDRRETFRKSINTVLPPTGKIDQWMLAFNGEDEVRFTTAKELTANQMSQLRELHDKTIGPTSNLTFLVDAAELDRIEAQREMLETQSDDDGDE
ncbi:toll/interleukin-1 receptor domain-containing protein [Arthrobacter pigmenti]